MESVVLSWVKKSNIVMEVGCINRKNPKIELDFWGVGSICQLVRNQLPEIWVGKLIKCALKNLFSTNSSTQTSDFSYLIRH